MRAYLYTTGTAFALVTVLHIWRMVSENALLAREPSFIAITVVAAAMSVWGFRLALRSGAK